MLALIFICHVSLNYPLFSLMFWLITQNGSECDYYSGFFLFFSIHGNHDDPCGLGGFCSLDNLHTAGLINYFGRQNSLKGMHLGIFLFTEILISIKKNMKINVSTRRSWCLCRYMSLKKIRKKLLSSVITMTK